MKTHTIAITTYLIFLTLGVCEQVPHPKTVPQQPAAGPLKQVSGIVRCDRNEKGNVTAARLLRKEKGQSSQILNISLASGVGAEMAHALEGKMVSARCRIILRKNRYWISVAEYEELKVPPEDKAPVDRTQTQPPAR